MAVDLVDPVTRALVAYPDVPHPLSEVHPSVRHRLTSTTHSHFDGINSALTAYLPMGLEALVKPPTDDLPSRVWCVWIQAYGLTHNYELFDWHDPNMPPGWQRMMKRSLRNHGKPAAAALKGWLGEDRPFRFHVFFSDDTSVCYVTTVDATPPIGCSAPVVESTLRLEGINGVWNLRHHRSRASDDARHTDRVAELLKL